MKKDGGVFVVPWPQGLVPSVSSWIFVDQEEDLLYQIDAATGRWTVYGGDAKTPLRGGTMEAEIAEALCRQAFLALVPQGLTA